MPSPMFWRIVRRLLTANYGRLFVILLALGAGAAVTSALLNLQLDAKRRLTSEFRALGANVIVAPRTPAAPDSVATLDEGILKQLPREYEGRTVPAVAFLYLIGEVAKRGTPHFEPAVLAGAQGFGMTEIRPGRRLEFDPTTENDPAACELGAKAATLLNVHAGDWLQLRNQGREASCHIFSILATGGAEDTQVFTPLLMAQQLAALPSQISLVQLSVTGTPDSVNSFIATLSRNLTGADVHGVRQLTEAEGRIYGRISGLLSATVILVLFLTSLCVMAGMSNVAIERKERCRSDESHRWFRAPRRAAIPCRSYSSRHRRRTHRLRDSASSPPSGWVRPSSESLHSRAGLCILFPWL